MQHRELCKRLLGEHFAMPEDVQHAYHCAMADLHFGPAHYGHGTEEQPMGFESACEVVAQWSRDALHGVWIDTDCEVVLDSEPEPFEDDDGNLCEPWWDAIYALDLRDVRKFLFGELAEYVR